MPRRKAQGLARRRSRGKSGARCSVETLYRVRDTTPQSFCAAKRRKNPAPSSEGAEAARRTRNLPQREPRAERRGGNAIPCRGYNPSVFSACKQAEKPAPLAQGSRGRAPAARWEARCKRSTLSGILSFRQPLRGCHLPRQRKVNRFAGALRQLSARLHLSAQSRLALSLPQSRHSTDFNLEQCGS